MHYHAEIWMPDNVEDVDAFVAETMAPHDEQEGDAHDGFWDWWQIGGRYTGAHDPGYEPEKDERNIEQCWLCGGTGRRDDAVGAAARMRNPEYGCNGCDGKGRSVKWPTEWARFDGDVKPVAEVPDDLKCYTLIVMHKLVPVNKRVVHQQEWTGEEWRPTDFDGFVKAELARLGIQGGKLVTVDYHS